MGSCAASLGMRSVLPHVMGFLDRSALHTYFGLGWGWLKVGGTYIRA